MNVEVDKAILAVNPCTACSRSHKEATSLTFSRQQYVSTKEKVKDMQEREQILQ